MEKLHNEFVVRRDINTAFGVLTDLEALAPCLPGATLEGRDGDAFIGSVKVKLGAIAANFGGSVHIAAKDDARYTVSLSAKGREKGGRGTAEAAIDARLEPIGANETLVVVDTDLKIAGKIAQFGRGIIGDVSKQLIDQFAANLNQLMSTSSDVDAALPSAGGSDDALELGSLLSGALAKRLVPLAAAIAVVVGTIIVLL